MQRHRVTNLLPLLLALAVASCATDSTPSPGPDCSGGNCDEAPTGPATDESSENCGGDSCEFTCESDSSTVSIEKLCDGTSDCSDGSDEVEFLCMFSCNDGSTVHIDTLCNGTSDCSDGSDEAENLCAFPCDDGSTVDDNLVCNGTSDCPDGSDESFCGDDDGSSG